ncbi:hypothetical protein LOK74_03135 [Brevibacillus humidisoli]|uniref:hypothetical protein n=1 Tax=Brevibacillus humidisoli TaxID=2895522 RepID=UPI001E3A7ACF|nr:hypothetical protein [Brevibacillus humidisoli]UFJ41542.1 hypothetical protein LOK74_03135 [Brevibacillus humidisoli]
MREQKAQLVQFDQINVNVIESASGIFVGTNYQCGWGSHNTSNSAFGQVSGDQNLVYHNINVLYDNDGIDTPIDDRDLIIEKRSC